MLGFDPDMVYTHTDVRKSLYFAAHSDKPGVVELHLPGTVRTLKMSAAAAEDLAVNLQINAEAARKWAELRR